MTYQKHNRHTQGGQHRRAPTRTEADPFANFANIVIYPAIPPLPTKPGLSFRLGDIPPETFDTAGRNRPFATYCANFPDATAICTDRTAPLAPYETLTPEKWRALNEVNSGVNTGIGHPEYRVLYPDSKNWTDPATGKERALVGDELIYGPNSDDVFANPISPHFKGPRKNGKPLGDCDDFAIAKQWLLINKYGFKPENVRLAYAQHQGFGNIDHMVALALTDQGVYVLDNFYEHPTLLENTKNQIRLVQDRQHPQRWVSLFLDGTIEERNLGNNFYKKTYRHDEIQIRTLKYYSITTPSAASALVPGWRCEAKHALNYSHQRVSGADHFTLWRQDGSVALEITEEHKTDNTLVSRIYQSTSASGKDSLRLDVTSDTASPSRKEISTIVQSMKEAGIECSPVAGDKNPVALPTFGQLGSLAESAMRPPAIAAR